MFVAIASSLRPGPRGPVSPLSRRTTPARSRQPEIAAGQLAPAALEGRPFAVFDAAEDLIAEETRRPAARQALAEHPAIGADADEDQVLAMLRASHGVEHALQRGAVAAEGLGAVLRGEIEAVGIDQRRRHGASKATPTLAATSPICRHVVASISMPSAMRLARAMRSGSPAISTGRAGSIG